MGIPSKLLSFVDQCFALHNFLMVFLSFEILLCQSTMNIYPSS